MTTVSLTFPGPLSTKRRRMRSGGAGTNNGNVTTTGSPVEQLQSEPSLETSAADQSVGSIGMMNDDENISEQKTTQTSKCKGATTIPIFLKKTYKMVDTCDPAIASWTEEGDMFVVKDPELFATNVIPQYFDHNKFSSFARQLNFYGFRKMQSKPIRNSDFDVSTSKYVTFFNENFKRGRCDLLKKIQRSTRGGGTTTPMDQSREILLLRDQVSNLEQQISEIMEQTEERVRRLEMEMLARMEQLTMSLQQQHRNQFQLESNTSIGSLMSRSSSQQQQHQQSMSMPAPLPQQSTFPNLSIGSQQQQQPQLQHNSTIGSSTWDVNAYSNSLRQSSVSSGANSVANIVGNQINFLNLQQQVQAQVAPPTLPPHPKQKQLPGGIIPTGSNGAALAAPDRMNSLRGISTMSRGISGLTRGASVESSASAVLLRNSWEDKFFSMLMLEANDQNIVSETNVTPTPINVGPSTISEETIIDMSQLNDGANLPTLSTAMATGADSNNNNGDEDELSDVSSGDLP